jgi:hypothetical protein
LNEQSLITVSLFSWLLLFCFSFFSDFHPKETKLEKKEKKRKEKTGAVSCPNKAGTDGI